MNKLESNFKNMVLVLSGITLFAAVALASVYTLTKEPIAQSKIAKQQNAVKEVLPPFYRIDPAKRVRSENGDSLNVYKAFDKNNVYVGVAVESFTNNGFAGLIKLMIGFDKEGTIVNYSVLEQKETPGLGTKMVDWFKTSKGNQNIIGKKGQLELTVSKDGGEVDAISAATISSRAFLAAVNKAYPVKWDAALVQPKEVKIEKAIKEVLPPFSRVNPAEVVTVNGVGDMNVYKAYDKKNVFVGAAVESFSEKGYNGKIKVMVGFDAKGNIVNYSVLEQNESSDKGGKMVEWFKTEKGNQSIIGKNPMTDNLTVRNDGGKVDAISGSTISSRAFLESVNNAYKAYVLKTENKGQNK